MSKNQNRLSYNDFEISNKQDIDLLDLIEILKDSQSEILAKNITKDYIHSLFTPLLHYIINHLNTVKDYDQNKIGYGVINNFEIVYILLNKKIYDLFFQKQKEEINQTEIDFEGERRDENYKRTIIRIEQIDETNKEDMKNQIKDLIFEENIKNLSEFDVNIDDYSSLEKYCELKKKEIISIFRYGYVVQERFINLLLQKAGDKVEELPNLIFFKKNKEKISFREIDRIILAKENVEIPQFTIYYKAEFIKNENFQIKEYDIYKGQNLVLSKDSVNYIEIKNSIDGYFERELNNEENEKILQNITSSMNSGGSKKVKNNNTYNAIVQFDELFSLKFKYTKINILFIFDSSFKQKFIKIAKNITDNFIKSGSIKFSFSIYFIHVEPDVSFISEIKKEKSLGESIKELSLQIEQLINSSNIQKNDADAKNREIKNLKQDADAKNKEINNLKLDADAKNKEIKYLKQEIEELEKKNEKISILIEEMETKKNIKTLKKKIKKENFSNILKEDIDKYGKYSNTQVIIGNLNNGAFITLESASDIINNEYDIIIDCISFCRLFEVQTNLEKILFNKYKKKILYYHNINLKKLIIIADYVFMKYFEEIRKFLPLQKGSITFLKEKYFVIRLSCKDTSLILNANIPGTQNGSFLYDDIKNIEFFIIYLCEITNMRKRKDFAYINFPIYNPINDCNFCYISKIQNSYYKEGNIEYNFTCRNSQKLDQCLAKHINYFLYESDKFDHSDYFKINEICSFFENIEKKSNKLKNNEFPIIFDNKKYIITDNTNERIRMLIEKKSDKIILRIAYKYIFQSELNKNLEINETKINVQKVKGTILALFKTYIIDRNLLYYISSLFLFITKININNLQLLLFEDTFKFLEMYLNNFKSIEITKIDNYENTSNNLYNASKEVDESISEVLKYIGDFKSKLKFSQLKDCKNNFFDIIFIKSYKNPDKDNPLFPEVENIKNLKQKMKSNGILCFQLVLRNQYLLENILQFLKAIFPKVIKCQIFLTEYFIMCFNENRELPDLSSDSKLNEMSQKIKKFSEFSLYNHDKIINTIKKLLIN